MKDLLVILAILIFRFELYRLLRGNWLRRFLKKKKDVKQPRKPLGMKPKSDQDCPFCVNEKGRQESSKPELPSAKSGDRPRSPQTKERITTSHSSSKTDSGDGGRVDVQTLDGKGNIVLSITVIEEQS